MKSYQDINSETIDRWVKDGWQWGKPISHNQFIDAINGKWEVFLTPTKPVPKEWLGNLNGKKILGLACGGGQQMPIFSALKGECTVLDYSNCQLESEKMVAKREHYNINIVKADMTKPLPFCDESFDLIFHPVSNDYVENVCPIFKECYRVLKKGGVMLSGLSNEINFIVDNEENKVINKMPFNPLINAEQKKQLEENDAGMQFSHTLTEQIGGQLKAGLTIKDIYDDTNGEGKLHELNIKTFFATYSVKEK